MLPRQGLPAPRVQDPALQRFLEQVSERLRSDSTIATLQALGVLDGAGKFNVPTTIAAPDVSGTVVPTLSMIPVPTDFRVRAGIDTVLLSWGNPYRVYTNHGQTLVYRHTANEFGNSVLIGTSFSMTYVDRQVSRNTTYFYWIRWEADTSTPDAPILSPPTDGFEVRTSELPSEAIMRITEEILNDPLTIALMTPISQTDPLPGITTPELEAARELLRRSDPTSSTAVIAARIGELETLLNSDILESVDLVTGENATEIARLSRTFIGTELGTEPNRFVADDRDGAEALRDAYAAANPAWLAEYDADESLAIELVYNA